MNAIIMCGGHPVCLVTNADHEQAMAQLRLERLKVIEVIHRKAKERGLKIRKPYSSRWYITSLTWKASPRIRTIDFSQHPVYSHTEPHNL